MDSATYINPCAYCVNWDETIEDEHKCNQGVPWYCVSVNCKYFSEAASIFPVSKPIIKLNLNKILVNTF